jgi:hypothetical protein
MNIFSAEIQDPTLFVFVFVQIAKHKVAKYHNYVLHVHQEDIARIDK